MNLFRPLFLACLVLGLGPLSAQENRVAVQLVPSGTRYVPGEPLRVAVVMDIAPGWHTYWVNPGTAGEPARIEWELPAGWQARGLEHPVPKRIEEGGLVTFGYEGRVALLDTLIPPVAGRGGSVALKAHLTWLVCRDVCLAEETNLELVLYPAAGRTTTTSAAFLEWEERIPLPSGKPSRVLKRWFGGWSLEVPASPDAGMAEFFPANREGLDVSKPCRARARGGRWVFALSRDPRVPFKDPEVVGIVVPPLPARPLLVRAPRPAP